MTRQISWLGLGAAGLIATTLLPIASAPASAQMVDDFMCSTFSYKCNQQKPLPPPQLAPGTEPEPAPVKKHVAVRKHKAVKRTAAAPESAPAAPAAATDAAK